MDTRILPSHSKIFDSSFTSVRAPIELDQRVGIGIGVLLSSSRKTLSLPHPGSSRCVETTSVSQWSARPISSAQMDTLYRQELWKSLRTRIAHVSFQPIDGVSSCWICTTPSWISVSKPCGNRPTVCQSPPQIRFAIQGWLHIAISGSNGDRELAPSGKQLSDKYLRV